MNGEKTVIKTICGPYSVHMGQVYRGASLNGAQIGTKILGAIDEIPYDGIIAQTNGEFLVTDNSIAAQIRSAVQPLATNCYAVVENGRQLTLLPRTVQVERRKTKSVKLEGIVDQSKM